MPEDRVVRGDGHSKDLGVNLVGRYSGDLILTITRLTQISGSTRTPSLSRTSWPAGEDSF
jgi:hypothetical protein